MCRFLGSKVTPDGKYNRAEPINFCYRLYNAFVLETHYPKKSNFIRRLENNQYRVSLFSSLQVAWLCIYFLCFISIWCLNFYLHRNFLEQWSFKATDVPWMPPGSTAVGLYFNHYFGDFQLGTVFSQIKNPYLPGLALPWSQPPTSIIFFWPFTLLSLPHSLLVFLLSSVLIFLFSIWKLSENLPSSQRFFVIQCVLLSLPLFISLDRGNFVLMTQGIVALMIFELLSSTFKNSKAVSWRFYIYLIFALSMKAYIAAILIPLLIIGYRKAIIRGILIFLGLNFILSFQYPGGPARVVYEILRGIFGPAVNGSDSLSTGVSISYFAYEIFKLLDSYFNTNILLNFLHNFGVFIGIFWFFMVCLLCVSRKLPENLKMVFILSLLQFVSPVSMAYTLTWSAIALIFLLKLNLLQQSSNQPSDQNVIRVPNILLFLTMLGCIFNLAPWPNQYWRLISPGFWLVLSIIWCIYSIMSHTREDSKNAD